MLLVNSCYLIRLFSLILISFCIGCAAPSAKLEEQSFISPLELEVFRFNNEGLRLAGTGRFLDAEMEFRKALSLAPETFPVQLNLAITLRELGVYEESEQLLLDLLSLQPNNPEALSALAVVYFATSRKSAGNDALVKAIDIAITQANWEQAAKLASLLANAWHNQANLQQAICFADLALSLNPTPTQALQFSRYLLEANNYASFDVYIQNGRLVLSQNPVLRLHNALADLGMGRLKEATDQLDRLELNIKKTPDIAAQITTLKVLTDLEATSELNKEHIKDFSVITEENFTKLEQLVPSLLVGSDLQLWPLAYRQKLYQLANYIKLQKEA